MNGRTAENRRLESERRRQEREVRQRQKDLERRLKERAKLSVLENSRLEVEAHENALDVLLSVHKEQSAPIEWAGFAAALPPAEPIRPGRHEFAAILRHGIGELQGSTNLTGASIEKARTLDELEYRTVANYYERELQEWKRMQDLARRVLAGEARAYSEAISEFSSLAEISQLGSSIHFTVHNPKLVECVLTVNGRELIPTEVKTLTAAGKLSVKKMPKARFHEIYQDYVCGCVLRLAREVLALLPVDQVLVTASVPGIDTASGQQADLPVLSAAIPRKVTDEMDFERIDPSNAMELFLHRGDVIASRKGGEFLSIEPLSPVDLAPAQPDRMDFASLLAKLRQLRAEIVSQTRPTTAVN